MKNSTDSISEKYYCVWTTTGASDSAQTLWRHHQRRRIQIWNTDCKQNGKTVDDLDKQKQSKSKIKLLWAFSCMHGSHGVIKDITAVKIRFLSRLFRISYRNHIKTRRLWNRIAHHIGLHDNFPTTIKKKNLNHMAT